MIKKNYWHVKGQRIFTWSGERESWEFPTCPFPVRLGNGQSLPTNALDPSTILAAKDHNSVHFYQWYSVKTKD